MHRRIHGFSRHERHKHQRRAIFATISATSWTYLVKKIPADQLLRWSFLLLFWSIWFGQIFLSADDDERHRQFMIRMLPVMLTNIPLFFINTEVLIPKVLRKYGIGAYLSSVLALIVTFIVLEGLLKSWRICDYTEHMAMHTSKSFFFIVFITAVSTGYGLVTHLVGEEKNRQDQQREHLQSELSFLRSQISPHFIFNILNSIVYLIRTKSEKAEPVTLHLSELMRYMLYESEDAQIPLEKELDYLKSYVELQRVRFEEDVDIHLQIDGTAGSQIIEPMLMIPFVENAFKHGVGTIEQPVIDIQVQFDGRELNFRVRNRIAPDTTGEKDSSSGIGLRNVRRRLELLHPKTHQLDIQEADGWFLVHLQLQF